MKKKTPRVESWIMEDNFVLNPETKFTTEKMGGEEKRIEHAKQNHKKRKIKGKEKE